jgi:hypothetical protein
MRSLAAWLLVLVASSIAAAQAPEGPRAVVFVDDSLRNDDAIADMLRSVAARQKRTVAGVRLFIPGNIDDAGLVALDARLNRYPGDTRVWLWMGGPLDADRAQSWRATLQRVLTTSGRRVSTLEIDIDDSPPELASFALRIAASEARVINPQVKIALAGSAARDSDRLNAIYTREVAPSIDLLGLAYGGHADQAAAFLSNIDPTATLISIGHGISEPPARAAQECVRTIMFGLGGKIGAVAFMGTPVALDACLTALAPAAPLLNGDVLALDAATAGLTLRIDGQDAHDRVRAQLLFDQEQQSTWLIYDAPAGATPLDVEVRLATDGRPTVVDFPSTGSPRSIASERDASTGVTRLRAPRSGRPTLIGFNEGASAGFTERTGVTAARKLSVEEIIAKHQQQQLAQDAVVENYVASARTEQHFRPTVTDSGYDVVSENTYFVDREGIEWEERAFFLNGSHWGADRPAFPLLQPEKVLSLPLALRLGDDYRYTLVGESTVDDVPCYEVNFEPIHTERSLYKGTVWIDRESFARVRVRAVQTRMSAPVVSNDETQTYRTVTTIDGRPVVLLTELIARQIVMIAGRNLMLEKHAQFDSFRVNADDFLDLRQAARSSDRIMFRETERGLRYYNKEGGTRVVSERGTTHAKAMAMGVLLDPSYTFPLPIFGINYLDFEFKGHPDTQLAILFAGVLAAGNIQRPKIGHTPLDASVDFFAIAPPATDRLFDGKEEREDQRLLTWPLSTSVNLGWQANAFLKVSAQYQFRFDGYVRDRTTEESFTVPSSTTTNGIGGAWEYRRGGYSIVANGTLFRRSSWKTWGATDDLQTSDDSRARYAKYSVIASRDFNLDAFQKIHIDAGLFGGRHLDRFSRYQFGMFDDTRIHGVPASGIRFDDLRMMRGSYSFNIFEQYRLDLFLEQAWGRDRLAGPDWHPLTGTGVGVNLRAPWHTMLRVDFGHSFLPDRYSGLGSTTLQVMLLKPLK